MTNRGAGGYLHPSLLAHLPQRRRAGREAQQLPAGALWYPTWAYTSEGDSNESVTSEALTGFPFVKNKDSKKCIKNVKALRHNMRQEDRFKNVPDNAVAKTDNEDQDSGERSFKCREQLSKNHSPLNCEDTQTKCRL